MIKMKNSGVEWIGEISEDWEVVKFKNLHSGTNVGESIDKDFCSDNEEGFIFYTAGLEPIHTSFTDFPLWKYTKENDLLLARNGTPYVYFPLQNAVYSDHIIRVSINNNYSKSFVKYAIEQSISNTVVDTVSIATWSASLWNTQKLPLPPKSTQQCIASYLDKKCGKIEETIQNQQQVIEKLKAYKQSLITEAVTGKIKIQNGKICGKYESYKDSKLKWFGDFKIPEKWSNIQVKSFVSIPVVDGSHESPELFDNGIPYISATAIENSKIDFSLKRGFISEKYCDECDKRYKPMRDDILMIKLGATTGQVAIVETDERFNIWVPLAAIRCNKNIALPKFIFYSFQSDYCLKQMEMSWTFGTQQTLRVSSIERLKIFLPNIETQKKYYTFPRKKMHRHRTKTKTNRKTNRI